MASLRPRFGLRTAVGTIVTSLIAAPFLLWPAISYNSSDSTAAGTDPVTITDFSTDFTVDADGELTATETIAAEFPYGRHGIFQYWDVTAPYDDHARLVPHDIEVSLDGGDVPVELSWEDGRHYRVAKIGDADAYVEAGSHVYTISYRIPGALAPLSAGAGTDGGSWTDDETRSAFYWNVVAGGWGMYMDQTESVVHLPAGVESVQCAVGWGAGATCDSTTSGNDVTVTTSALQPRTPVTVRAVVSQEPPGQVRLPWTPAWDGVLGQSVLALVVALILAAGLWLLGRLWERSTRETPPGFPVVFEPPQGPGGRALTPAQAYYVVHETASPQAFTATIFDLAERGYLTLDQQDKREWTVTARQAADPADLDDASASVLASLGLTGSGAVFAVDRSVSAGKVLKAAPAPMNGKVTAWARENRLVVGKGSESLAKLCFVAAGVLGGVLAFTHPAGVTLWALPFFGFFIGSVGVLNSGVGTRRTAQGRDLWSRSGGFYRFLSTPSAQDRFDFAANKGLYLAYIPYAVAFGCADEWAAKYKAATGESAPLPLWYAGYAGASTSGFGSIQDSFDSALSSSISAYQATQRSSGSGGGGGFSGGGGGGGGGGGSW